MSHPTPTIVLPYATSEGIREFVPLEDFEALAAKIENQRKELNRFNQGITSQQNRERQMRSELDKMQIYEGIVRSVRKILGAENEEKTEDAAKRVIEERDLARERGFITADVLTDTERERDRLKADVAELNQRLIERTQDMLAKQTELIQEARQAKREARRLAKVVEWWEGLRGDSAGVAGYHRNGDVATWDEFEIPSVEANPVRPNAADCGQCADTSAEDDRWSLTDEGQKLLEGQ